MNSIEQNLPVSSMEEPTKELLSSTLNSVTGRSTVFDRKTTLQLIACVRKRPILWDRQFLRKRLSSCQLEWEYIQQKEFPSYTVDQLKARWKTMRDSFRREIKRIEFGEFAQSRWPLYEDMLFLNGHYRLKKSLQHKIPAPLAKRKATARRSEDSVAVEPKKEVAIDHSTSCTIGKAHNNEREREHQQPTSSVTIADPPSPVVRVSLYVSYSPTDISPQQQPVVVHLRIHRYQ
ncbi:uncharacterized protein LOC128298860 isoform X2 [Anopheles moucheti]|uniref:uncharacterized protein LOC128298860 isoform X2 n=1 Tax=Anopheles moucheti TaxID=186751 RepID=UPI0022F09025|nr:uncharacterized protein LOC128298860 isoform X2 [Anopheles moucheti]